MADTPNPSPVRDGKPSPSDASASSAARDRRRDGPPPTPFDHPFFLPVLFAGFAVWFGYDGWLTTDPDMLEHQTFNRYGFGVLVVLFVWSLFRGLRESREAAEKVGENLAGGPGEPGAGAR